MTISGSDMEIDLSGCSPQRENSGLNSRTYAGAYIAYKALTAPLEPLNEGAFRALRVVIPEGNMMMARFPAFMASWGSPLPTVVDTVWRALAPALPERDPGRRTAARWARPLRFPARSGARDAASSRQSIEAGGWGGRPDRDGEDASMSVCQGDVRNTPIETMELKTPVLVLERSLWQDSGGAGRFRGGLGVQTHDPIPGRWALERRSSGAPRPSCAPWGLERRQGGRAGPYADPLARSRGLRIVDRAAACSVRQARS